MELDGFIQRRFGSDLGIQIGSELVEVKTEWMDNRADHTVNVVVECVFQLSSTSLAGIA
jgi:hypothetical protein